MVDGHLTDNLKMPHANWHPVCLLVWESVIRHNQSCNQQLLTKNLKISFRWSCLVECQWEDQCLHTSSATFPFLEVIEAIKLMGAAHLSLYTRGPSIRWSNLVQIKVRVSCVWSLCAYLDIETPKWYILWDIPLEILLSIKPCTGVSMV